MRKAEEVSLHPNMLPKETCIFVLAYVSVLSTRMLRIYIYAYNNSLASQGKFSFKKKKKKKLLVLLITKYYHPKRSSKLWNSNPKQETLGFLTDLKDTTGPTSRQISISCSSVASYGILPTVTEIPPNESIVTTPKTLTSENPI
jgi:hypothetical protein